METLRLDAGPPCQQLGENKQGPRPPLPAALDEASPGGRRQALSSLRGLTSSVLFPGWTDSESPSDHAAVTKDRDQEA